MKSWFRSVARGRFLEIGLALGLGYSLASLANSVAEAGSITLAQHVGRDPFTRDDNITDLLNLFSAPFYLNFSIGSTAIVYGKVLSELVALGLVALVGVFVVRRRDDVLGVCPFCASRIPYESTHCAYCGSGVEPAES
jgi:hypothetical protein